MTDMDGWVAFVGAGHHSTESLYPNIAHIPEFDLVAVCDLDETRAAYAARRFGAREYYTDLDVMLGAVEPDGVCVVGPPDMHHSVGLRCLARGIHLPARRDSRHQVPPRRGENLGQIVGLVRADREPPGRDGNSHAGKDQHQECRPPPQHAPQSLHLIALPPVGPPAGTG